MDYKVKYHITIYIVLSKFEHLRSTHYYWWFSRYNKIMTMFMPRLFVLL